MTACLTPQQQKALMLHHRQRMIRRAEEGVSRAEGAERGPAKKYLDDVKSLSDAQVWAAFKRWRARGGAEEA